MSPSSSSAPGKLRQIPSCFSAFFEECQKEDSLDLGFRLGPSKVPLKLQEFLTICEREYNMVSYDEVLYDNNLQTFVNKQGVSEFIVMMFKFLDEGELNTARDVLRNWADYLVVFVNYSGYLCEYQFDHGPTVHRLKWEYKSECYTNASSFS